MPVTMEQVLRVLEPDEPDYELAAMLGSGALPHLRTLIAGDNRLGLASRAAYLAGLIDDDQAVAVLREAASSDDVLTRLAVAATLENVSQQSRQRLANALVADDDLGVRKLTLRALVGGSELGEEAPDLESQISEMARKEPNAYLRQLAREIATKPN